MDKQTIFFEDCEASKECLEIELRIGGCSVDNMPTWPAHMMDDEEKDIHYARKKHDANDYT